MPKKYTFDQKISKVVDVVNNLEESKRKDLIQFLKTKNENLRISELVVEAKRFLNIKKSFNSTSEEYWLLRGWSKEESKQRKVPKKNHKSVFKKEAWENKINPLTNSVFTERDINFEIKSRRKNNKEYWISKGFNDEEAKNEVAKFQSYRGSKQNYDNSIKDRTITQKLYWMNKKGLSEQEADLKIKEIQDHGSLKYFCLKLGIKNGVEKYCSRCRNISFKNHIIFAYNDNFHDVDLFVEYILSTWEEYCQTRFHASKESLKIFLPLIDFCETKNWDFNVGFGSKQEFKIYYTKTNFFRYDFFIKDLKLIFEYDGELFHKSNHQKTNDEQKTKLAEKNNFELIRLTSSDKYDIILKQIDSKVPGFLKFVKQKYFINGNRRKNDLT